MRTQGVCLGRYVNHHMQWNAEVELFQDVANQDGR